MVRVEPVVGLCAVSCVCQLGSVHLRLWGGGWGGDEDTDPGSGRGWWFF